MGIFSEKPKLGDGILNFRWQYNSNINGIVQAGYILGYKDAADSLYNTYKDRPDIDSVGIPIVFLYRQYLELLFKNIIINHYSNINNLTDAESILRKCGHNLNKIWNKTLIILNQSNFEQEIGSKNYSNLVHDVNKLVNEYNKFDELSFNFRYYFKLKGLNDTLPKSLSIDLNLLNIIIDKIDSLLFSTYNYIPKD